MSGQGSRICSLFAWGSILALIGLVAYSYLDEGVVHTLVKRDLSSEENNEQLQAYFQSWGPLAAPVYIAFVTVEVIVAPIPGLMLYAPGGFVFGGFLGGLLALIGNVLGAGIACKLMRVLGRSRLEWMWEAEHIAKLDERFSSAGVWVIFALRVNPLTSSDLVSYAAGLTSLPIRKVMLGTLLGMAPLCWIQAFLANELLTSFPVLVYPLIGLCAAYVVLAVVAVRRALSRRTSGRVNADGN